METSGAATASPRGPGSVRTLDEVQCLLPRLQEHLGPGCGASQGPGDNAEGGAHSQVTRAGSASLVSSESQPCVGDPNEKMPPSAMEECGLPLGNGGVRAAILPLLVYLSPGRVAL